MSKLGRTPIFLPMSVELKIISGKVVLKGPKGTLEYPLPDGINVKVEDHKVFVSQDTNVDMPRPTYGLARAILNNMITGVSSGFQKRLTLIGVGYRANLQGSTLDLQLGFSHPTRLQVPKGITVEIDKNTSILISGIDAQKVGQFAAEIRAMKSPEPYKGKGIRYENEYVRKKAGKAAKAATAKK